MGTAKELDGTASLSIYERDPSPAPQPAVQLGELLVGPRLIYIDKRLRDGWSTAIVAKKDEGGAVRLTLLHGRDLFRRASMSSIALHWNEPVCWRATVRPF
jgi:hypothetical protein